MTQRGRVNQKITDAVAQVDVKIVGEAPAVALANDYLGAFQAQATLFANMVQQQQTNSVLGLAAVAKQVGLRGARRRKPAGPTEDGGNGKPLSPGAEQPEPKGPDYPFDGPPEPKPYPVSPGEDTGPTDPPGSNPATPSQENGESSGESDIITGKEIVSVMYRLCNLVEKSISGRPVVT